LNKNFSNEFSLYLHHTSIVIEFFISIAMAYVSCGFGNSIGISNL